jgi:hypothetical protein
LSALDRGAGQAILLQRRSLYISADPGSLLADNAVFDSTAARHGSIRSYCEFANRMTREMKDDYNMQLVFAMEKTGAC